MIQNLVHSVARLPFGHEELTSRSMHVVDEIRTTLGPVFKVVEPYIPGWVVNEEKHYWTEGLSLQTMKQYINDGKVRKDE